MTDRPSQTPAGPARYLLFPAITFCWGSNWPAIKLSVLEMPVWQYRATTAVAAGLLMLGIALASGMPVKVPRRQWPALLAISLTNVTLWLVLAAYGVKLLESGQAALIGYTAPLWVVILARIFLGEALTFRRLGAVVIGLGGILILLWPSLGEFGDRPLGILCITGAAISFGAGTIITKRVKWAVPPMSFAGWHLLIGSIPIVAIAATEPFTMHQASAAAWWAAVYTTLIGLVLAYLLWFRTVALFPAGVASISTLAVPAVGLLSGAAVLGETIGWRELVALVMVLAAVALVVIEPRRTRQTAA
ncbi:MAG TPA: EamA family transporter [Alphaproteobacteria bacterium]|nr:EamA family transporter [Alphaproteobacteria bacterium]